MPAQSVQMPDATDQLSGSGPTASPSIAPRYLIALFYNCAISS